MAPLKDWVVGGQRTRRRNSSILRIGHNHGEVDNGFSKELDAALEGESEFRTWIKDNIDKRDLNGIAITTETLDSLDKQTYEMLKENIEPFYAAELLGQAGRAKSDLRVKRTKGVKKTTTRFVKFAKTFQDFLKNYSGIVDIMAQSTLPSLPGYRLMLTEIGKQSVRRNGLWHSISALQCKSVDPPW